jgi:hypothetical protein
MIPGSHDAATSYLASRRGYDNSTSNSGGSFAVTQDKKASYRTQLENGIRYFDLRFRKERGADAAFYQLYHTYFLQTNMKEAIDEINGFLKSYPNEVVFVQMQPDGDDDDAYAIVGAQEIRDAIYTPYRQASHLVSRLPSAVNAIPGYKGTATNLFVEGYQDFDDIRLLRKYRGLGGLGDDFNLATAPYDGDITIPDPKTLSSSGIKLDYSGLTLGDVRGRIILVGSNLKGFPGHGFSDKGLNVVLLGPGEFSTGDIRQDNYFPSSLSNKLDSIKNFAYADDDYDKKLPLNFTSASTIDWQLDSNDSPINWADGVNPTLAMWLNNDPGRAPVYGNPHGDLGDEYDKIKSSFASSSTPVGELAKYNFDQKLRDRRGLSGVMLGDFYTTPPEYYIDANNEPTNLHKDKYQPSDWLTQMMWRQSALVAPQIWTNDIMRKDHPVTQLDPVTQGGSGVIGTGLRKVLEGQPITIQWDDYFGRSLPGLTDVSQYKVTQVSYKELGLEATDSRVRGDSSVTNFMRWAGKSKGTFKGVGSSIVRQLPYGVENFRVLPSEGLQGDRFFKVEPIHNSQAFGTPVYFMVGDGI